MTQEELSDIVLPGQAKQESKYENVREKLLQLNKHDIIQNKGVENDLQNLELSIQDKVKNSKVANKENRKSSRIKNINNDEELKKSSFSVGPQKQRYSKLSSERF